MKQQRTGNDPGFQKVTEKLPRGGIDTAAAAVLSDERKVHKMRFRPCIDIHNGKVKQIVGGSLRDEGDCAQTNFASDLDARAYAEMYRRDGLSGGHIILLNAAGSPYYEETRRQAFAALRAYPGGMQIGGGITPENAAEYLEAGASHVIVTSYVFRDGRFHPERLEKLVRETGKKHLVLDLSCRKKDGDYYVVTDRWQKFTEMKLTPDILDELAAYCDEFLIHGVDVEGKQAGMEEGLTVYARTVGKAPGYIRRRHRLHGGSGPV